MSGFYNYSYSSDSDCSSDGGSTGLGGLPVPDFKPFSCSTPKKDIKYRSPDMPELVRKAEFGSRGIDRDSMLCNTTGQNLGTSKVARVVRLRKSTATRNLVVENQATKQQKRQSAYIRRGSKLYDGHASKKVLKSVAGSPEAEGTPKHGCHICSKAFYHASALQVHLLLHSSTLPRKKMAQIDSKNAETDRERAAASRIPSIGDKTPTGISDNSPSKGSDDEEKFFHRFDLNLTHLDECMRQKSNASIDKRYKCAICGKNFSKKTSMRIHQTKRHVHTREFLIFV